MDRATNIKMLRKEPVTCFKEQPGGQSGWNWHEMRGEEVGTVNGGLAICRPL